MDGDVAAPPPVRFGGVRGSPNAPFGYRMRGPSDFTRSSWKPSKLLSGPGPKEFAKQAEIQRMREDLRYLQVIQDEKIEDKKRINAGVRKCVRLGMEAYDEDLEERRQRLRELLLRDEASLTRELVQWAKQQEKLRAERLAIEAEEAERQRESERSEFLENKRLQRWAMTNQQLRDQRWQVRTRDTKKANLIQIQLNEDKRKRELEDAEYWERIQRERTEAEMTIEETKAARRADLERRGAQELRAQIETRRNASAAADLCNQKKFEPGFLDIGSRDETPEQKHKRMKEARAEIEMEIQKSRKSLEQRRIQEEALDLLDASIVSREEKPIDKLARKREILAYMDSLKEFREAVAQREIQADECARRWATEADSKRLEEKRKARDKRASLNRELKSAWDRQLEDKRRREMLELRQPDQPEAHATGRKHDEPTITEIRAQRKEYGRELIAQHERIQAERERQECLVEEQIRAFEEEQEREENGLAQKLECIGARLRVPGLP
ncbi:hypothetical protein QAD02_019151 [Eretmocerus hayati]|uniref:Uncharacterized protein n=1 Tax=Eretmocerus hayati TaxID=131215 RepID=A0ACC2PL90_9HYME|nr:hypothetical protein QAD02_019151 [Eretmocerus hayati]